MTVDSSTSSSIHISWTGSCSAVDEYVVTWELDTTRKCRDVKLAKETVIKDSTSYNITGLEEDSHYTITVIANRIGIAVNSSIMGRTAEAGKYTCCGRVYY